MIFDRSKVVDDLSDDLEQWIGWEGYFADLLVDLKRNVENECKNNFSAFYKFEKEQVACRLTAEKYSCNYQFFYPVESPKKKPELVPFDTCQELVDWYCEREGLQLSENQLPSIWVRFRDSEAKSLITDYYIDSVRLEGSSGSLKELFDEYKLLDGTPIGKEEQ